MARNVAIENNGGYRAVHVFLNYAGKEQTEYEGIYNKKGTATARVSFWRRHLGDKFIDGWVEEGEIKEWKRLD